MLPKLSVSHVDEHLKEAVADNEGALKNQQIRASLSAAGSNTELMAGILKAVKKADSGKTHGASSARELLEALAHENPNVRSTALRSFGTDDGRVGTLVAEATADDTSPVRKEATRTLVALGTLAPLSTHWLSSRGLLGHALSRSASPALSF